MSFRAGYVGFIGLPNAGKSSLANAIVGQKFSIVCSKAQTTRRRVLGIHNGANFQMILTDAPGVIKASRGINSFLQEEYQDVIDKSDVLLACVNIDENNVERLDDVVNLCKAANKPWVIVITKTDLPKPQRIGLLRERYKDMGAPIIALSASKNTDTHREVLEETVVPLLPQSEKPLFDQELYTTENMRQLCEEIIREKCFEFLHEEVPYGLAVLVRKFEEGATLQKIYADIMVEKNSYKSIVIGKGGSHLERIGTAARKDIELMVGTKVYLELHVAVKPDWAKNQMVLKELGYVISGD